MATHPKTVCVLWTKTRLVLYSLITCCMVWDGLQSGQNISASFRHWAFPECLTCTDVAWHPLMQGCARLVSLESNLTRLCFKWVESELSRLGKNKCWVESELSRGRQKWVRVESESEIWVEHNPALMLLFFSSCAHWRKCWAFSVPEKVIQTSEPSLWWRI